MEKKTINIEMTYEQMKEIALGLNLLSAERNCYLLDDDNIKYRDGIQKYLDLDNELIRKIKSKIDELKELV